eukprot:7137406-Pyramimonas_sp.AAC.1
MAEGVAGGPGMAGPDGRVHHHFGFSFPAGAEPAFQFNFNPQASAPPHSSSPPGPGGQPEGGHFPPSGGAFSGARWEDMVGQFSEFATAAAAHQAGGGAGREGVPQQFPFPAAFE